MFPCFTEKITKHKPASNKKKREKISANLKQWVARKKETSEKKNKAAANLQESSFDVTWPGSSSGKYWGICPSNWDPYSQMTLYPKLIPGQCLKVCVSHVFFPFFSFSPRLSNQEDGTQKATTFDSYFFLLHSVLRHINTFHNSASLKSLKVVWRCPNICLVDSISFLAAFASLRKHFFRSQDILLSATTTQGQTEGKSMQIVPTQGQKKRSGIYRRGRQKEKKEMLSCGASFSCFW